MRLTPSHVLILLILVLIAVGSLGLKLLNQTEDLSGQMAALAARMDRLGAAVEQVSGQADSALRHAEEAERQAIEAAGARARAEAARRTAEEESRLLSAEKENALQEAAQAQREVERVRQEREGELKRLEEALGQIVETRRTALGLVMSLGSDSMQFDFDEATLRPENRELLSRIIGILLTTKSYGIYVYGHTDDLGSEEYNLDLSRRRAETVRDYLVQGGIDPARITTRGFGKSRPVVSARTPAARAKNRRVEIGIVEASIGYQAATTGSQK